MEHQLTEEELKERALAAGMKLEDYELAVLHERRVLAAMESLRALIPAELGDREAAGMITDLYARLLVERCGAQMAISVHKELAGSLLALYVIESALGGDSNGS